MADKARKWTDKKLTRMERQLTLIYQQAEKEIRADWDNFMKGLNARLAVKQQALQAAIKKAKDDLQKSIRWGTLMNKKYKDMVDKTAENLTNVNKIALAYVNGELPSIYIRNYNGISSDIKQVIKAYDWTAVNEETVRQLTVLNKTLMLPDAKVNVAKDKRWNVKNINNAVLQGILQGESIPEISARIFPEISKGQDLSDKGILKKNRNAAIRNARTMVTAAENRGRLAAQERAEQSGIVLQKEWISTADSRTREWHLSMDGQTVDTNEYFVDGNGNKLLYPGDYGAPAETVYNCRCSMTTKVIGFRKGDGHIDYVDRPEREDLHDRQIRQERQERKK